MDAGLTQREVVMKMSAKSDPSLTQPMKDLARSSKDATGEEEKYQRLLKNRIKDYDQAMRLKADLAKAGIGRELTEEQKYQQLLKTRIADYNTALRLKKDLGNAGIGGVNAHGGGLGGVNAHGGGFGNTFGQGLVDMSGLGFLTKLGTAAGAAVAALTLLARGLEEGEKATKRFYSAMQYTPEKGKAVSNPLVRRRLREQEDKDAGFFSRAWTNLKNVFHKKSHQDMVFDTRTGEAGYRQDLPSTHKDYERYLKQRKSIPRGSRPQLLTEEQFVESRKSGRTLDREMYEATANREAAVAEALARSHERQKRFGLQRDQRQMEAEAQAAMGMIGYKNRLTENAGAQRQAVINAAQRNAPYAREQFIEDANRQIEYRHALAEAGAAGAARQHTIKKQLDLGQAQEADLRGRLKGALQKERDAQSAVREEIEKGAKGRGREFIDKANEKALAAAQQAKLLQDELNASQERNLGLRKEGEQSILQTIQQQSALRQAQLQMTQRQLEMAKRAGQTEKQDLAMMSPVALHSLHRVFQKADRGDRLTEAENRLVLANRGAAGKLYDKVAAERLGRGNTGQMIKDIQNWSGRTARQEHLKAQEIKMKQEIAVQIKVDTQTLTDRLAKSIAPQIQGMMEQMKQTLKNEIDRIWHQRQVQVRGMFPDQPG